MIFEGLFPQRNAWSCIEWH